MKKKLSYPNPFEQRRRLFGEMMLDAHYLSEEELDDLLDQQKTQPERRLGYLCLKQGYAEKSEVMDVLTRQLPVILPYSLI